MPRPKVESREIARIPRPRARNTAAAAIVVEVRTLTPPGAPPTVRPKFVSVTLEREDGGSVTLAIRRREIDDVIAALQAARSEL